METSKVVWDVIKGQLTEKQSSKAPLVSYLFYLSPWLYFGRTIDIEIKTVRRQNDVFKYPAFRLNNIERIAPITNIYEERMLNTLINYRFVANEQITFKGTIATYYKAIEKVALLVYKRLEIPMPQQPAKNYYMKSLLDLRILSLMREGMDHGFLKQTIGYKHRQFIENNAFREQIAGLMFDSFLNSVQRLKE